ncbi:MAG TPA: Gx transporter family protein [Firmicutes bacterium]|jgi:heptaprenyl diphosphate synthase|nr:Gx transporter family protein [Bacillota bacterium]
MNTTRKIVLLGILVALALALHVAERALPLPVLPVPGVKLGLANIVTLTAIFILPLPEITLLVVGRTILAAAFGGGLSGFLFSLAGGLLSMLVMYLMVHRATDWFSLPAISVMGALFHNLGQLLVAAFIVRTLGIFLYLPLLLLSAGLTGLAVGFTTLVLLRSLLKTKLVAVPERLRCILA